MSSIWVPDWEISISEESGEGSGSYEKLTHSDSALPK